MELVVEAFNMEHALFCINSGVHNLIIGNEVFASTYSYSFSENEVINLINNKKSTKIWIKVDAFFFEPDINRLICYLKWLSRLNVDFVIFQDFAVAQINDELKLNLKLHYASQTTNTSYYQFDFFLENNIKSLFLARELTITELIEICQNKGSMKIEIQGHGYGFIMHSRWKMISNFENYFNEKISNDDNKLIQIKEKLRKYPNLIFENRHGTHMFTGYQIYTIDLLSKLDSLGIDYLRLDFFNTNFDYAKTITDLYLKILTKKTDIDNTINLFNELHKNHCIDHGFLGNIKDLPHLQKD